MRPRTCRCATVGTSVSTVKAVTVWTATRTSLQRRRRSASTESTAPAAWAAPRKALFARPAIGQANQRSVCAPSTSNPFARHTEPRGRCNAQRATGVLAPESAVRRAPDRPGSALVASGRPVERPYSLPMIRADAPAAVLPDAP